MELLGEKIKGDKGNDRESEHDAVENYVPRFSVR